MRVATALAVAFLALCAPSALGAGGDVWLEFYADPQADSGSAPDLTQLVLGYGDNGIASFDAWARIPSSDTTSTVTVFVDTDDSADTGDPSHSGADYSFVAFHGGRSFDFERWSSGRWVTDNGRAYVSYRSPYLDFSVDRAEIGKPSAVNVVAESAAGGVRDRVPDTGTIHYRLTPLVLTISSFTATRSPRAERLELGVTRSDSGGPLLGEPPLCHGRVAGKVVFATVLDNAKEGKRAYCAWKFPKALVGKKARLTITIAYASRKVSRSVSVTIR